MSHMFRQRCHNNSEEKRRGTSAELSSSLALPPAPEIESLGMPMVSTLHPICGPGTSFGRSLLHRAVCEMDLSGVQSQLSSGSGDYLEQRDQKGYCPIHSACALCLKDPVNSAIAGEIVRLLISAGADASIRDLDGNTSLHWAARAGDKGTSELLLLKNSPKGKFYVGLSGVLLKSLVVF
jgi:Ankyrin repeats (many copies)